jgi:hypothetical protein
MDMEKEIATGSLAISRMSLIRRYYIQEPASSYKPAKQDAMIAQ